MQRRDFLQAAAGAGLLAWRLPAAAATAPRLLVLVELKGGNDGLNTVVPLDDPAYAALRPRLALARDALPRLADSTGLHPSLEPLLASWRDGRLAVVQGLGYPAPNLSHFRSIEIWDTASRSDEYRDEGWLARAFAGRAPPAGLAADGVVVGSSDLGPLSGPGARAIALTSPEDFLREARLVQAPSPARANAALAHILRVERDIEASARRLAPGPEPRAAFPAGPFGTALRTAARLAANPATASVIKVSLTGFDTHANQLAVQAQLLRQLGEGLAALRAALEESGRWRDAVIATYSEFGRRARENGSGGTDHGTAAPHFVLGGAVKGGLYGAMPRLDRLDGEGNLAFTTDFRSYYATLLAGTTGLDPVPVLGGRFASLGFLPVA